MKTYYAVCNVYGPISHRIEAASDEEAMEIFDAADSRKWIDGQETDAEDDLDIAGDSMSESDFSAALEAAGCRMVRDLSGIIVGQGPTLRNAHIADGWELWVVE